MHRLILLGFLLFFAACSAPQGKKLATTSAEGLAPVAAGPLVIARPPTTEASLTYASRGETVSLYPNATVTVKLPSYNRDGYEWRLAEIPDSSVLQLVSRDFTPGVDLSKPGEQTLVFRAVGPGDVDVKMWYGTLWASEMDSVRPYDFIASVSAEQPKPERKVKKSSKKN